MLKRVPFIALALAASMAALWYYALKNPTDTSNHVLVVGTNAEYYPFSFIRDGAFTGFDIDLVETLAQRLNKKISIKDMSFDALIPEAQLGSIDIIAAGLTPTEQRAQRILFTKPYITSDPLMIITNAKNSSINGVADLKGKSVVVNEGFTADFYASKLPEIQLTRLATTTESFLSLQSGRSDAFISAKSAVKPFFEKYSTNEYKIIPIEGTSDSYALALSKKAADLLPVVQAELDAMEADGTLAQLKKKWGFAV